MILDSKQIAEFQKTVRDFYSKHGRHDLAWRIPENDSSFDPYKILVSEIMLQQTQVARVMPKYEEFLAKFPDVQVLANASLGKILGVWNGLGYNRRAKFLWQAARMVVADFDSAIPTDVKELEKLPGVGPNTAGAIAVYAFNRPDVFIETNIRTVFIHHFILAKGQTQGLALGKVADAELMDLVEETLDLKNPRKWYWALMDYGSYLKQSVGNLNWASRSYSKQSTFAGSRRQLRGAIIKTLLDGERDLMELKNILADERLETVLAELTREGLILKRGKYYSIS